MIHVVELAIQARRHSGCRDGPGQIDHVNRRELLGAIAEHRCHAQSRQAIHLDEIVLVIRAVHRGWPKDDPWQPAATHHGFARELAPAIRRDWIGRVIRLAGPALSGGPAGGHRTHQHEPAGIAGSLCGAQQVCSPIAVAGQVRRRVPRRHHAGHMVHYVLARRGATQRVHVVQVALHQARARRAKMCCPLGRTDERGDIVAALA